MAALEEEAVAWRDNGHFIEVFPPLPQHPDRRRCRRRCSRADGLSHSSFAMFLCSCRSRIRSVGAEEMLLIKQDMCRTIHADMIGDGSAPPNVAVRGPVHVDTQQVAALCC